MNEAVIILGSGGHAKVLVDILLRSNVKILGVTDPNRTPNSLWLDVPVLGNDDTIHAHPPETLKLINGIGALPGDTALRRQLFSRFKARGYCFKTIIDPLAFTASDVVLAEGVQVMAGVILQPGVNIGENSIVNSGAIVEHDCQIGNNVHIGPGAVLSGSVSIGDRVHIGTGAIVIQNIHIADDSVIGAGAVVTRDIASHQIVYPARSQVQDRS